MGRAFISYDAERHGNYKHLISAWVANDNSISFSDVSTDTNINSTNNTYIRSVIKSRIRLANCFIVLVGDYTSMNRWVEWECMKAMEMLKPIYVIRIGYYNMPSVLNGYWNLYIVNGFNKENIAYVLNRH